MIHVDNSWYFNVTSYLPNWWGFHEEWTLKLQISHGTHCKLSVNSITGSQQKAQATVYPLCTVLDLSHPRILKARGAKNEQIHSVLHALAVRCGMFIFMACTVCHLAKKRRIWLGQTTRSKRHRNGLRSSEVEFPKWVKFMGFHGFPTRFSGFSTLFSNLLLVFGIIFYRFCIMVFIPMLHHHLGKILVILFRALTEANLRNKSRCICFIYAHRIHVWYKFTHFYHINQPNLG